MFEGDAVDGGLDRRVDQLDDQHEEQAAEQQRALDAAVAEPEGERREQRHHGELEAKGDFVPRGGGEAGERILDRGEDAPQAGFSFMRAFFYVGIPSVNSSSSWAERRRPRRGFSLS